MSPQGSCGTTAIYCYGKIPTVASQILPTGPVFVERLIRHFLSHPSPTHPSIFFNPFPVLCIPPIMVVFSNMPHSLLFSPNTILMFPYDMKWTEQIYLSRQCQCTYSTPIWCHLIISPSLHRKILPQLSICLLELLLCHVLETKQDS